MKSTGYSLSTTKAQGELLTFSVNQSSETIQTVRKPLESLLPNKHVSIGVLPFDVMESTLDKSIQKNRVNEVDFYYSGKEIARWLIKKSEYNKSIHDFFI
ncbi:hypothetical protein J2D69_12520 [Lysinibacillus sphaericus]|uniref:Uncharacterized protein n=3 Tax=Lysinibacillus TaxID=400634 RepID=B1HPA9_LYSSC|nr:MULTISPECIES: hypothetical protein [Lysinibacillus]MBE5083532.1 hypothetical protein [Bacillus thuringiensis]ACA40555.1 hypothetical protein Bsph_3036 [Lysinibacillus sphaericus C3-41]AMO33449.1 hypothetical protein AR327_13865 [Lysinibacillus sphaericus]AMR91448.1 hypothetical protein A1T07_15350 [Lysinibacillus sphaericus]ANA45496.1 hypothetical protein A2J09_08010 [Lysinibacillus sphaericus]